MNILQSGKEVSHIPSNATIKSQGIVNYIRINTVNVLCNRNEKDSRQVAFAIFETSDYDYFCVDCEIWRFEKRKRKKPAQEVVADLHFEMS